MIGHRRGDYVHLYPLEHVNLSQSTNDTYPTAIKIALQFQITRLHATLMDWRRHFGAALLVSKINLGGTAIGTGLNADPATRVWSARSFVS